MQNSKPKINNRGFSLVEILVSVAILAFVIGPLLYSFIVSQRITNKSHYLGEGTLNSRNIIETIKAEGVREVLRQADPSGSTPVSPFGGWIDTSWGYTWDTDDGVYEFLVRDITRGTFGNSTGASSTPAYDAIIRIDATPYRTGDPLNPGINEQLMSDYAPMDTIFVQPRDDFSDSTYDAAYVDPVTAYNDPDTIYFDPDSLAIIYFKEEVDATGAAISISDIKGRYKRVITLDIRDSCGNVDVDGNDLGCDGSASGNVSMIVYYDYTFTHAGITYTYTFDRDVYWESYEPGQDDIVVYLCYRPYYALSGLNTDDIIIRNIHMIGTKVFVVKQKPLDPGGPDPVRESGYRAVIRQYENSSLSGSGEARTEVYTNFRSNFAGGAITPSHFIHWKTYNVFSSVSVDIDSDLLVTFTSNERMYDLDVAVYNAGDLTALPLITFKATHLE